MKEVQLSNGMKAIVWDRDYELVSQHRWFYLNGGASTDVDGRRISMHRLILGLKLGDGKEVDHINHNRLDNQRHNLRIRTRSQNCANRCFSRGKSQYKGVWWAKRNQKWAAQIYVNGKHISLGHFDTEYEAADVYDFAAIKYFGRFARLNCAEFPLQTKIGEKVKCQTPLEHLMTS